MHYDGNRTLVGDQRAQELSANARPTHPEDHYPLDLAIPIRQRETADPLPCILALLGQFRDAL